MEQKQRHVSGRREGKLPLSVKLCYGAGSFAKAVQGLAISVYLLYFYTNALGIRPGLAANIVFWGRIWDIVNDPLVGFAVDRTHSAGGRCRSYLVRYAVPAGVVLAACFMAPELSGTATVVWVTVVYLLQSLTSTLTQIPLNTLMGRLTVDREERAQLNQIGLFISLAGNYIVTAYTLPLVSLAGGGDVRRGFLWVGAAFGLAYALSYLIVAWGTRGYEQGSEQPAQGARERHPMHLGALLRNRVWLCVNGLYLFFMVAITMESSAMVYYYQYVFQDIGLLASYSKVSTVSSLLVFLALPVLVKFLGNSGVLAVGAASYVAGHLLRFALQDGSMPVLAAGWVFGSLGLSLISSTIILNIFDAKVYGEWKTGVRHDALLMSGFTLSTKVGMAFGSAVVGWLLDLKPFTEQIAVQLPEVNQLFFLLNTLAPAVMVGVSLVLAFPVMCNEKQLPQMKQEISLRGGQGVDHT